MNIHELDSYDLGDAVKFNDRLNPRIWGADEKMRPEVREQLLKIADDFREFLGIDVEVKDITVSGSNAAYTYTPHSDIDLHLVVDLPQADSSDVYRELFDAKKYAYNDMHNIQIGGYDVELYVQDANKRHHSQGIYSVMNDDWVSVPKRRRPQVDDISVKSKFEDLGHRIEAAIKSQDYEKISALTDKLKDYRQAGLDAHGEFGSENLAFKILRTQGLIKKLYDARNEAKDRLLSLDERKKKKKKKVRYGYGGYWYPGTAYAGQDHPAGTEGGDGGGDGGGESIREDAGMTWDGVNPTTDMFTSEDATMTWDGVNPSTAMFTTETQRQSDEEILRDFIDFCVKELKLKHMPRIKLRKDPQWPKVHKTFGRYQDESQTLEVAWGNRHIMDVLRTVAHELTHKRQHEREEVPPSAGETGSEYENEANARAGILMRDWARLHPEHFEAGQVTDLTEEELLDEAVKDRAAAMAVMTCLIAGGSLQGCATNPAGTTQQVIKTTQDAGRVAQTAKKITRAGTEEEVNQELRNISRAAGGGDPGAANSSNIIRLWRMLKAKPQPPYTDDEPPVNAPAPPVKRMPQYENASGYIPTRAQAKDPRYSMALTVDIKPGQVGKEANKLKLKTDRQGHPQIARANGLFENLYKEYQQFKKKAREDYSPDNPPGPEFKPTMPKGTLRVDVSDVYDWYKLGQHISNMKGLGKHDFGAGPPSSIISFGDEDTEHKFIDQIKATGLDVTDIDPRDPKKRPGKKIKTDPTYNVDEALQIPVSKEQRAAEDYYKFIVGKIKLGRVLNRQEQEFFKTYNLKKKLAEFAPSPDRGDDGQGSDYLTQLANRWWNAADPRDQKRIADVIRTFGYEITQVESEDDAVQLTDIQGKSDPIFISADEFDPDLNEADEKRRRFLGALARGVGLGAVGVIGAKYGLKNKEHDPDVMFAQRIPDDQDREKFMRLLKQREGYKAQQMVGDTTATTALVINSMAIKKYKKQMAEKYNLQDEIKEQAVTESAADHVRMVMSRAADIMKQRGFRAVGQLSDADLDRIAKDTDTTRHDVDIILNIDHEHERVSAEARFPGAPDVKMPGKQRGITEGADDEAWELVGSTLPEIKKFTTGLGLENNETSVAEITPIITTLPDQQISPDVIPKLKNLTSDHIVPGHDANILKGIIKISGRPDAREQYVRLMNMRDQQEVNMPGRQARQRGYDLGNLFDAVKSGKYESPVLLKLPTGVYVIGGRTRLYAALALNMPIRVKILTPASFAKQAIKEDEDLDEVKMSPSALEKFAASPEAKGIRAGFEAELIFRDTQGESDELDPEPDYDADERCYSIQQVIDFFDNDEYGYGLSDRQRNRLEEALDETYMTWRDEQIISDFRNDAEDLIRDILLEETPMDQRIHFYLTDSLQMSDEEADAVIKAGAEAPKFTNSDAQKDYADENPEYKAYLEAADEAEQELEESVEFSVNRQDEYWDEALDKYRDDYSGDDDSFFSDVGLRWMSDVANEYNLDWPVWNMDARGNSGSRDWETIGALLQDAVDMPVKVSSNYHSTTRREGQWIIEPDGSLSPDDPDDEAGLEIVSPPMPLLTAIEKLRAVTDWANNPKTGNAYTNSSTGLHMGVSLPSMKSEADGEDTGIDYVKLILFLGDKYVQQQFGREANTYCASALDKLKQNIKGKRSDPAGVVKLLQHGLTELAHRELQKGVGTSKYTSAHIQPGYIEFRSPGGDWLAKADEEIGVLENTMLRFARAMAIAGDPNAERQEYAKKLYKLVTADNPEYADQLKLFSEFSAGTINKEQLKKQWAETVLQKEVPGVGQEEYEVYGRNNKDNPNGVVATFYARDYDDAYDQFLRKYGANINDLDVRIKQPWFDVFDDKGEIVKTIRAKDVDTATDRAQYEFGQQWTDAWNIYRRPDDTPEPKAVPSPRAQVAKRIVKPKPQAVGDDDASDWEAVYKPTGRVFDTLAHADTAQALAWRDMVMRSHGFTNVNDILVRRVGHKQAVDARTDSADLQRSLGVRDIETDVAQNFEPRRQNYELVSDEDPDRVIHRMPNATADEVRAWIAQQEAGGMPAGFLRTRIVAEAIDPVSGAGAIPPRNDPKSIGKKTVEPVEKTFKQPVKSGLYKSAIGQAISQQDLENMTSQIQVARKLGDSVMEMEDTPPEVLKALDQAAQKNGYRNWADVKANPRSESAVMTVAKLANTILRTTVPHHEKIFYKSKTDENFADGKVKGKSRPGRVKRAGASCAGSVTDLRARAKKYGGEKGRMYHWCANMKSGRKK